MESLPDEDEEEESELKTEVRILAAPERIVRVAGKTCPVSQLGLLRNRSSSSTAAGAGGGCCCGRSYGPTAYLFRLFVTIFPPERESMAIFFFTERESVAKNSKKKKNGLFFIRFSVFYSKRSCIFQVLLFHVICFAVFFFLFK